MIVLRNEGNGKAVILKKDYSTIELGKGEYITIEESLVLRYPGVIKRYEDEEFRNLNTKKETKKQEPKEEVQKKVEEVKKEKQDEKPKRKPRRTKKTEEKGESND
jgi:hypothetical protein